MINSDCGEGDVGPFFSLGISHFINVTLILIFMRENRRKIWGLVPRWEEKILKWGLCLLICCSSVYVSQAQTEPRVNLELVNVSLVKAIEELRVQTKYNL